LRWRALVDLVEMAIFWKTLSAKKEPFGLEEVLVALWTRDSFLTALAPFLLILFYFFIIQIYNFIF
jgi:hypothetical protein